MIENTVDAAPEKHVPVVKKVTGGFKVRVGNVPHPMKEKHFVEWVELITSDGRLYRRWLCPGEIPEAIFYVKAERVTAREYCSLHGHWKG
jgi:superoxide reductase